MAKETFDYQKLSAELDKILDEMQSTDIDIDEAVKKYEQGMKILAELESRLKTAENKVKKVRADFGSR